MGVSSLAVMGNSLLLQQAKMPSQLLARAEAGTKSETL